jgi:hypothetical protein
MNSVKEQANAETAKLSPTANYTLQNYTSAGGARSESGKPDRNASS